MTRTECLDVPHTSLTRRLAKVAFTAVALFAHTAALEAATASPTVESVQYGQPRAISAEFFGLNGNMGTIADPWADDHLVRALQTSGAKTIRYPGGTVATFWDWNSGKVFEGLSDDDVGESRFVKNFSTNQTSYPLNSLARAHQKTGVTPIFVLNMVNYTVDQQIAHLKAAQSLGLPIKYIELGNEYYFGSGAHPPVVRKYPSVESYAREARTWANKIKLDFPDARLAYIGAGVVTDLTKSARRRDWDRRLTAAMPNMDALTLHVYVTANLLDGDSRGSQAEQGYSITAPERSEYACMQNKRLQNPEGVAQLLSKVRTSWASVAGIGNPHAPLNKTPIWITEFNLWDKVGGVAGTWAHGLSVARMLDTFLLDRRVEMADMHNFFAQAAFTAVWRYPKELRAPCGNARIAVEKYSMTAAGNAFSMFAKMATNSVRAQRLSTADGTAGTAPVYGWVFTDARGNASTVLVNEGPIERSIDLIKITGGANHEMRRNWSSPDTFVVSGTSIAADTLPANGVVNLPPYSISTLTR